METEGYGGYDYVLITGAAIIKDTFFFLIPNLDGTLLEAIQKLSVLVKNLMQHKAGKQKYVASH